MDSLYTLDEIVNEIDRYAMELHTLYQIVNWHWASSNGERIPSVNDIKTEITRMLYDVIDRSVYCISTGGITVTREVNKKEKENKMLFGVHFTFSFEPTIKHTEN